MKSLSLLVFAALFASPRPTPAELRVARVFGDHMVLQRDLKLSVWGSADPGDKVSVSIAGQSGSGVADAAGKWRAQVGPLSAGGPHELSVTGRATLTFKDVLVGDVYVCSGQSNMEWTLGSARDAATEIAAANHPTLRHLGVQKAISAAPLEDIQGTWQECTPATAGGWTAVGYFFGRHLNQVLNIPIGLIHTSWGGTVCEAWTSAEALKTMPDFKPAVEQIEATRADQPRLEREYAEKMFAYKKSLETLDAGSQENRKPWSDPTVDVSGWKTAELPGNWENGPLPGFDGVVWFRRDVVIPAPWTGKDLSLSLGPIDDNDITYWNGEKIGATDGWQAPRQYKIPGAHVKPGMNTIVVRVTDTGGGGGFHGKPEQMKLEGPGPAIALNGAWSWAVGLDFSKIPAAPALPAGNNPNAPTALYNAMIAPLIPYGIKGAIWYQGESNVGRAKQYQTLFPLMIRDWRSRWGVGEFPFYFVQLANFLAPQPQPGESGWAELREAQELTLRTPATGQAVIIDIGEAADIHPRNKQDVGQRLAVWALGSSYGLKMEISGPLYASMAVEGAAIRVKFTHVGKGLLARGGPLQTFAICGEDKKWVWADAKIDGETVVVSSGQVAKPLAVRYAWADNPEGCNLYNQDGLPASPFRSDR